MQKGFAFHSKACRLFTDVYCDPVYYVNLMRKK